MKKPLLLVSFQIALVLAMAVAPKEAVAQTSTETEKSAIRALLGKQVDAWNRGDLEGFMAGYWKSPELSFISGTTETRGWEPTLERYRKKYQGEGKEMGSWTFSICASKCSGRRRRWCAAIGI